MKAILISMFLIAGSTNGFGQGTTGTYSDSCSRILRDVSYYWKLDSLGQNGYRACNYRRFLNCKMDALTSAEVLERLGKPNFTTRNQNAFWYFYYFFDGRIIPQSAGYSEELLFIKFYFGSDYRLRSIAIDAEDYN